MHAASNKKYQESSAPGIRSGAMGRGQTEGGVGDQTEGDQTRSSPCSGTLQHERSMSHGTSGHPQRTQSMGSIQRVSVNSMKKSFKKEQERALDITTAELVNYKRLFDTFDTDGSDCLSFDELKYMLLCLGIALDDESIAELREEFDDDGNGTLDFDEFVQLMQVADLQSKRTISSEEEKKHITQLNSWRFAHNTEWRMTWDTTILMITFYYALRSIYEIYKRDQLTTGFFVVEVMISLILLADVGIFSNSAFQDENGKMNDNIKDVVKRYATSYLVFDVLGAFPFDLFYIAADAQYHLSTVYLVFRFMRLLRVVRVATTLFLPYSLTGYLTPGFVYFMYHVAPVFRAVFYFVFIVHCLTVGWLLVVDDPVRVEYWDALYMVLYTISTVGYGDIFVVGRAQRLYCSMMFILGTMMNGIVISQMSVFLSKADIVTERKDKMRETLAVLSHFDIPKETQAEILSFQNHLLEHNLGSSHESLIAALPRSIQDNLGLFMKIKYISLVPMFASASHECKVALAQFLFNIVFQPQQFIIIAGEEGKEMYFLGHGVADVILPKGNYIATLLKGNFFGEIALLVDGAKRTASIKALTYCDVFRLEKRDFTAILNKFPMFKDSVKIQMEERVAQFQAGQEKAKAAELEKKEEKKKGSPLPQKVSPKVSPVHYERALRDDTQSSNGAESSINKKGTTSSLHKRPVSGILRKQTYSDDKPLIDLKPELISAVEQNNNSVETRDARDNKAMRMSMHGNSHNSSMLKIPMESSIFDVVAEGSSTGEDSSDKGSRSRRPPSTITAEQRDKARAMALGFLQGGTPGLVQQPSSVDTWQEPGTFQRTGIQPTSSFNPNADGPPRPPPAEPTTQHELRALVDRMNRMENYLEDQAEGGEPALDPRVVHQHQPERKGSLTRPGAVEYSQVHVFDQSGDFNNKPSSNYSSRSNPTTTSFRGDGQLSANPSANQRRRVSINLPEQHDQPKSVASTHSGAPSPTVGDPSHEHDVQASPTGLSFGSVPPPGSSQVYQEGTGSTI